MLLIGLAIAPNAIAQVSVNINFGTPPVWAPADRVEVEYYYLPDIDVYYDVPHRNFIYLSRNTWIRSNALPARYRGYNLNGGRVEYLTDYRGNSPYSYHKKHKVIYHTNNVYVQKHNNEKHKSQGKKHR